MVTGLWLLSLQTNLIDARFVQGDYDIPDAPDVIRLTFDGPIFGGSDSSTVVGATILADGIPLSYEDTDGNMHLGTVELVSDTIVIEVHKCSPVFSPSYQLDSISGIIDEAGFPVNVVNNALL